MAKYYTKHRGRYHPAVGLERFMSNPADGVWIVQRHPGRHSISLIARLGEVPDHATHAAFARHRDLIASVIATYLHKNYPFIEIADAIAKAVATKEASDGN